jgi:hypothetical protein
MIPNPIIALMTDYGMKDPFVGILKGVIAEIAPDARIIDITHDIPSGDIKRGAVYLWQSVPFFPQGTIFVGVVDPGVGTDRDPIAIETETAIFIGPDNGLFSFILPSNFRAWVIKNQEFLLPLTGNTFHGRDIFAPAAAYVATGVQPADLGVPADKVVLLPFPLLKIIDPNTIVGEILFADRFGNLLTSIGRFYPCGDQEYRLNPWHKDHQVSKSGSEYSAVKMGIELPDGTIVPWVKTFSDLTEGECGCLVGGSGLLEIVSYRKSAAEILGLLESAPITLKRLRD